MTESAELTAKGERLDLPDDPVSVQVTIKVGRARDLDLDDWLTRVSVAAGLWVTHDIEQANRIAQIIVHTMRQDNQR